MLLNNLQAYGCGLVFKMNWVLCYRDSQKISGEASILREKKMEIKAGEGERYRGL